MANTVTAPKVELFKGTGWEECDTFVRSIRAAAWKEDNLEEDRWIANYVSLHLAGKALRWHSRLPADIRRDWSKLEIALLDQWPVPCDDDDDDDDAENAELSIVPTPAAAPDQFKNGATQGHFHSVIKVTSVGSNSQFYLGFTGLCGDCTLTKGIQSAMRVFVDVQSNPHTVEVSPKEKRPSHNYSWAAIHWNDSNPNLRIAAGSENWGRISLVDSISLKSSYNSDAQSRVTAWDISVTGDILPTWFQGNEKTVLDVFIDEASLEIVVAADSPNYAARFPKEVKARMFLQRLN